MCLGAKGLTSRKSVDKRADQEMRAYAARDTVEKAFRPPQECRAHEAGRCYKGDQCFESHNVPYHLITCCSVLGPKQNHFNKRLRTCTSIRVGKECQYSHTPQEEPTNVPREEEMLQANLLEEGIEATASALAEKQLASEATSARRTPPFDRAQAECDAVAKAKQDEFEAKLPPLKGGQLHASAACARPCAQRGG